MKISPKQLKLYAVTDSNWLCEGETLEKSLEELIRAGVTCVQFREKNKGDEEIIRKAFRLKEICNHYGVPFLINDRPDIARQVGADGVHVGLSDMGIEKTRAILGEDFIIGGSAHNVAEALAAQKAGADYLGCGAVFGSATKTDVTTLPLEELSAITKAVDIPVVAIGGITSENVSRLKNTNIAGVAVIRALFASENKTVAAKQILHLLEEF